MSTPPAPGPTRRSRLPKVWPGYLIALAFFAIASGEMIIDPASSEQETLLTYLTWLVGLGYWLFCVHRFHTVMAEATGGAHPISPGRAVGFHFIPFYNLYWLFRWTNAVADLVNARAPTAGRMPRGWAGAILLVGLLVARFDAAPGLLVLFAVAQYLRRKIRQATDARP